MLRVLTYHRVDDPDRTGHLDPAIVSATPDDFRAQMEHIRRWYRPVSLAEVVASFHGGLPLPSRAVHVTFDDAYEDFESNAWPVLRALGIPVTLFVATAYPAPDGPAFWWDRLHRAAGDGVPGWWADEVRAATARQSLEPTVAADLDARALLRYLPHPVTEELVDRLCREVGVREPPSNDILGWDRLRVLADQGVVIGAHTRRHSALSYLEPEQARLDLRASMDDIAAELGHRPRWVSYPYGVCNESVAALAAAEGCCLGFTSEDGLNTPGETDPLRLRRTNITRRTTGALFGLRMLPWFANLDRWRHRDEERLRSA